MPDISTVLQTDVIQETGPSNSEIKNLRISEKRDFELENCKLIAKIREEKSEDQEDSRLNINKKGEKSKNKFNQNPAMVEEINVKEISNSQMFN